MVDYAYYRSAYGGTLPQTAFVTALPEARGVILGLLHPRLPEDLTPEQQDAVRMAICAQADAGLDSPVREESTPEYRAVYADTVVRIHGMPVAPAAVGYLNRAGVLQRWV